MVQTIQIKICQKVQIIEKITCVQVQISSEFYCVQVQIITSMLIEKGQMEQWLYNLIIISSNGVSNT